MAKQKKQKLVLTTDEQTERDRVTMLYEQTQEKWDEAEELRMQIEDVESDASDLDRDANTAQTELEDDIGARLQKAAEAEAKALNKVNKNPKIRFVAEEDPKPIEMPLTKAETLWVYGWRVVKVEQRDEVAELRAVAERLGFKIDKDVAVKKGK